MYVDVMKRMQRISAMQGEARKEALADLKCAPLDDGEQEEVFKALEASAAGGELLIQAPSTSK